MSLSIDFSFDEKINFVGLSLSVYDIEGENKTINKNFNRNIGISIRYELEEDLKRTDFSSFPTPDEN